MEHISNVACSLCGAVGQTHRVAVLRTETIRRRDYEVEVVLRRCSACGGECENTRDADWRPAAYARYRADMGMVTPESLVAFRLAYGLRPEEVAKLLGWEEAALERFERGALQSGAQDASLAALISPGGMADAIIATPDAIGGDHRAD